MSGSTITDSLLQQISNSATRSGDGVALKVLDKALDIQATQAAQLIEGVRRARVDPTSPLGQQIDVRA